MIDSSDGWWLFVLALVVGGGLSTYLSRNDYPKIKYDRKKKDKDIV